MLSITMPIKRLPKVESCCICVTDMKSATAIIAVLGIVTSPALAWAVVRHSYVIRVSCFLTTSAERTDVIDINLNHIMSFGFGTNAGLGPSCLGKTKDADKNLKSADIALSESQSDDFLQFVKIFGWTVLFTDVVFLMCSIWFLVRIFTPPLARAATCFLWTCIVSLILSFVYGMVYVYACSSIGGSFPMFEFAFAIFDVILTIIQLYFAYVVYCYILRDQNDQAQNGSSSMIGTNIDYIWNTVQGYLPSQLTAYLRYMFRHEFGMIIWPVCATQYEPSSGKMHGPLTIVKWMLFTVNLFLLASSFAYLLSLFLFQSAPTTADVFIGFGIISAVIGLIFAIMIAIQMYYAKCTNPSDTLCLIIYSLFWSYFIIIVRSHREDM